MLVGYPELIRLNQQIQTLVIACGLCWIIKQWYDDIRGFFFYELLMALIIKKIEFTFFKKN